MKLRTTAMPTRPRSRNRIHDIDAVAVGQLERVEKALTAIKTTRVALTEQEGTVHQVMFDWLDTTLAATAHR